jgi:hypothetical protein
MNTTKKERVGAASVIHGMNDQGLVRIRREQEARIARNLANAKKRRAQEKNRKSLNIIGVYLP